MSATPPVFVLGRFPPPLDGQTLATERVASLLSDEFGVRRVNTQAPEGTLVRPDGFSATRMWHYVNLGRRLRSTFAEAPTAPVLWNSISPLPLGHGRDVITTLPAFRPGQPVHAVLHRALLETLFERPYTAFTARAMVRRVQTFVFQSHRLSKACAPYIPASQRAIIPNTIDDDHICTRDEVQHKRTLRTRCAGEGAPLHLLFASNMLPTKGYRETLHAVGRLNAEGVPVRAEFAGGWTTVTDKAAFEAEVRALGLNNIVRHHGRVSDRAALRAMHLAADVFVLPTYYPTESQPTAIIEAMNAGTPVITTVGSVAADMVRDGQEGLLVPARDGDAIAAAARRLADIDLWTTLSEGARARYETVFSPPVVQARWIALTSGRPFPSVGSNEIP